MKTALITGITGLDGSYLAEFLWEKGYKVYGLANPGMLDITKAENYLGFKAKMAFEAGLKSTVDWFRGNIRKGR